MKIIFLHYTCGLVDRGSEISTRLLANYLSSSGHSVWLFQSGKTKEGEKYSVQQISLPIKPSEGYHLTVIGKIFSRLYLDIKSLLVLLFSLKSIGEIIKIKPDLIIPTNGFWQIIICKLIKFFYKFKIVVIGRAGIGWTDKDNIKLNPDLFIALTEKAREWVKTIRPGLKTIYLPNPIDLKEFLNIKSFTRVNLPRPIILTVAALTAYKRLDKLIVACSLIPKVSLLIVGQGEMYNYLLSLGNRKMASRFAIKQFSYQDMASVYKSCDLFILISDKHEAFGRVLLEAMACKLPIITTNTSPRREIVGNKGIFIDSIKPNELATVISKEVNKLYKIDYGDQLSKFDINVLGKLYEQEFQKLVP